jgi:mRNA-degrading endonuclease toxin of MazEF toxin-antitoxin module
LNDRKPRRYFHRNRDTTPKSLCVNSQIRTLSVARLGRRIGGLNTDEVDRVIEGLLGLVG